MAEWVIAFLIMIYGLIFGSFFNVCIYRIPAGMSVVKPRSRCGTCGHELSWMDLIPVLSYMVLDGSCRYCKAKISFRYAAVELLTGLLFMGAYFRFGLTYLFLSHCILISLLIIISFIDLDHQIIPDELNAAIAILAIIVLISGSGVTWMDGLLGMLLGGGSLLLIALLTGAMGGGDIKLMAAAGLYLGLVQVGVALYFGFIFGGLISLVLLVFKLKGRKDAIAFGPYLSLGILVSLFWGNQIGDYISRFWG